MRLPSSKANENNMRLSQTLFYTLRDRPADAEVESHALLVRAGFLQKLMAGVYIYGPLFTRVLAKISQIVREEMNAAGGVEMLMPAVQPKEIWVESGRWDRYVKDGILFHFADRKGSEVCLGPTHEEVITTFVKRAVTSYRQLPVTLYQIQNKFRDEIRPRFGVIRGREFLMKDAYSFDADEEGQDRSYQAMHDAYCRIFERCGLKFTVVEADSGAIGGSGSQEFMVDADTGEDAILLCPQCNYAANVEKAASLLPAGEKSDTNLKPLEKHKTPNVRSVEQLTKFFSGYPASRMVKTILYQVVYKDKEETVAVLMRGDLEINEVKLANALDCLALKLADDNAVRKATGAEPGFAGPIGFKGKILADLSVQGLNNFLCGGNETDVHYLNANAGRDFPSPPFKELRKAHGCESCARCQKGALKETRGTEVGHIFKLGTKYSKAMEATFTAEDGSVKPFVMGCYGIGVSRIAAAAIEQNHDANGMIWPEPIAPFRVNLLLVGHKEAVQKELAEKLYGDLQKAGVEVMFDDRPLSPGVKFKDADLIGMPYQVTVGRDAQEGKVEFKTRKTGAVEKVSVAECLLRLGRS